MTPIEKDKLEVLCKKWELSELKINKGIFMADDNSGITMNLRGDVPLLGVTIAGTFQTEGHGILKVSDIQTEMNQIMKSSSKKLQSSVTEQAKSTSNIEALQTSGKQERSNIDATNPKLGAGDTSAKKGTTKATCPDCKTIFEISLDEARVLYDKYDGVYCEKCRDKPMEKKHEEEHKKAEAGKDAKVEECKTDTPKIVKTCKICGIELSGARALECFQNDPQKPVMICEECEEKPEKVQEQTRKNMDEKLPEIIKETENKLTVNTIKQYICPAATDAEAYNFLQLCLHRDLNPFLKEAYLIKYGNAPATMVVGKDAFTRKAEESGKLDGYEAGIIVLNKDKQVERRIGVVQFEGDILVGGWTKVYRKDMKYPFVTEVPLTEYLKRKPDGTPQSSWSIMPGTMIRKVALVQALREAFTKELGGCYDAVEMGTQDNIK